MGLVQIKFQNTVVDPVQEDNVQGDAIACRELMEKSANSFASVLRSSCTLEQSRKRIANTTNDESNVPSRPAAPLGASLFSDIPWADTGDHQTRQKILLLAIIRLINDWCCCSSHQTEAFGQGSQNYAEGKRSFEEGDGYLQR